MVIFLLLRPVTAAAVLALLFVLLAGCQAPQRTPPGLATLQGKAAIPLVPVRSEQSLQAFVVEQRSYSGEQEDGGTPPFSSLIPVSYEAPTPLLLPGAKRVDTYTLQRLLLDASANKPLLINVQPLGASGAEMITDAVWLSGPGQSGSLQSQDPKQLRFANHLQTLTGGDKTRPIVLYCADRQCWHAYNAGTRAVVLGYRSVYWYRGGLRAWYAAGLPTRLSSDDRW